MFRALSTSLPARHTHTHDEEEARTLSSRPTQTDGGRRGRCEVHAQRSLVAPPPFFLEALKRGFGAPAGAQELELQDKPPSPVRPATPRKLLETRWILAKESTNSLPPPPRTHNLDTSSGPGWHPGAGGSWGGRGGPLLFMY